MPGLTSAKATVLLSLYDREKALLVLYSSDTATEVSN